MAQEDFFDNLRIASRTLTPPKVSGEQGVQTDAYIAHRIDSADLWLTRKSVEGFNPADFADWPKQDRDELEKEVNAFLAIAAKVPADKPATKAQSSQARKHLERIIQIVSSHIVQEWLEAQQKMMEEAKKAAKANGWFFQMDEKEVLESLLGKYKAPRMRIRTQDREVVLDPIARFGSGKQGVVDLVVMPSFETAYILAFKDDSWQIVSPRRSAHSRPFTQTTLVNTITRLPND